MKNIALSQLIAKFVLVSVVTLFALVSFNARATNYNYSYDYSLACIYNKTSKHITFYYQWKNSGWKSATIAPGQYKPVVWTHKQNNYSNGYYNNGYNNYGSYNNNSYSNSYAPPRLKIKYDPYLSYNASWQVVEIQGSASPERQCGYYGTNYHFVYDQNYNYGYNGYIKLVSH